MTAGGRTMPHRYRTQLCRNNDGSHCKRQICFFAHSIEELRVPDHSHLKIPDEIKQASASKDANKDAPASDAEPAGSPKAAPSSPPAAVASSHDAAAGTAAVKRDRCNSKGGISRAAAAGLQGLPPQPAAALGVGLGVTPGCMGMMESSGGPATPASSPAVSGMLNTSALGALLSCPGVLHMSQPQGGTARLNDSSLAAQWVQQQQLAALQNGCYSTPAGPAAALRRAASLDVAAAAAPGRLSLDTPAVTTGRFSLDTVHPGGQNPGARGWATSSLFSNSMAADPEVPEPTNSPQSAARRAYLLQQQQMQLLQNQQEQQLDVAAVEQQLQIILAQQQQQMRQKAAWAGNASTTAPGSRRGSYVDYALAGGSRRSSYVDYAGSSRRSSYVDYAMAGGGSRRGSYVDYAAAGGGSRRGSYVDYGFGGSRRGSYVDYGFNAASRRASYVDYVSGTGSPPLSPATSSMLGSGSSGLPEECQSASSHASPYLGMPAAAWPGPALHRTISGPAAYGSLSTIPATALRYNSMDPSALAAAATVNQVPGSAADAAAARAQMELLNCSPQTMAAAVMSSGIPEGCVAQHFTPAQLAPEQSIGGDKLNLQNVAELVDSVNRGELGEQGNVVLTGVIGLLMQQLQQPQLAAVQEV